MITLKVCCKESLGIKSNMDLETSGQAVAIEKDKKHENKAQKERGEKNVMKSAKRPRERNQTV